MAALCAATAIISVVVPFAAGLSLLGTVPMGLLAYRYRLRVLITATVAGAIIAFLIAGMGGFMTVVNCAYIGGLTGIVKRRRRGTPTVLLWALVAGALFGVATVAALAVLARLRHLIFESMTANINGLAAVIARIPDMQGAADQLKRDFATALDALAVPVLRVLGVVHRHGHTHRLVGAVAGDGPAARHSRCAQAGVLHRQRTDRTRACAAARRPLPLSHRRPRRARTRCR